MFVWIVPQLLKVIECLFATAEDKQALSHGLIRLACINKTGLCQQPFSQMPCLALMLHWLVLHA